MLKMASYNISFSNLKNLLLFFSLLALVLSHEPNKFLEKFKDLDKINVDNVILASEYARARQLLGKELKKHLVKKSLQYRNTLKSIGDSWDFEDPGIINCTVGDEFYIKSPNFPNYPPGYPPNLNMAWEFLGDSAVGQIQLSFPVISTRWSRGCTKDRVSIFWGPSFGNHKKFCGIFVNKVVRKTNPMKIGFTSNDDGYTRMGFLCQVRCLPPPPPTTVVSTTTTTFMPMCVVEPTCAADPIPANECDDIDLPDYCECTDCDNSITITCHVCTPCDMEVFLNYQIYVPLTIDIRCDCPENGFQVSDYLCGNLGQITTVEYCSNEDYSCIDDTTFPQGLDRVFKVCDPGFCYDTCHLDLYPCSQNDRDGKENSRQTTELQVMKRQQRNDETIEFDCTEKENFPGLCKKKVTTCKPVIASKSFVDQSSSFYALEYDFLCTTKIQKGFLTLGMGSKVDEVHIKLSPDKLSHIPQAVEPLLPYVEVVVTYSSDPPACNSCDNAWLWKLSTNDLLGINALCKDGSETTDIDEYVEDNQVPLCH